MPLLVVDEQRGGSTHGLGQALPKCVDRISRYPRHRDEAIGEVVDVAVGPDRRRVAGTVIGVALRTDPRECGELVAATGVRVVGDLAVDVLAAAVADRVVTELLGAGDGVALLRHRQPVEGVVLVGAC